MNLRTVVVCIFVVVLLPNACHSQEQTLEFVKQIGVGWQSDKYGWMSFVAFSPDGKMVASDGASSPEDVSGNLTIWSFPDGNLIRQLPGSAIRVLELPSGKQVATFGDFGAFALAFSPDGKTLATGHWNVVTLWNVMTGERLATLHGLGRYVKGLAFNKDGGLLAASTDLGSLQIWDARRLVRIHSIQIGGGEVSEPKFSPDGRFVGLGIYGTGTA